MADEQSDGQAEENTNRPDPFFKLLTRLEAVQLGLQPVETELQYSTRADLVLSVPSGLSLENTMFNFFRPLNVLEFKSQGDQLTLREFIRNDLRADLLFLQGSDESYLNILNIIVSSRLPQGFITLASQRGITFAPEAGKPWLWRGQVGFQDVAIVVCRDLPLEPLYYPWLLFAPADTRKWKAYVQRLLAEHNRELLKIVKQLRPREFIMLTKNFEELWEIARAEGLLNTENQAELDEEEVEAVATLLETLNGDKLNKVLAKLDPQIREELLRLLIQKGQQG